MIKPWLIWIAGFLSFPLAGIAGIAVAGRVDSPLAALTGGLVTGAVIGAGQALCSSRRLPALRWIIASSFGMGFGLLLGASTVGYATSLGDLALMGLLTGLAFGAAQALFLPATTPQRFVWAATVPPMWALGWTVTTVGGIDVGQQFTVFGSFGAITFSVLSGALLQVLLPARAAPRPSTQMGSLS
jgi:hypothetical protein